MQLIKVVFLAVAISITAFQQCADDTPPEYRRLFELPVKQQAVEFKKYPLEQQADIYVYALRYEPPATQFGTFLASNGKSAIPILLRRLKEEKNDRLRSYFVDVLYKMHTEYCSLKDDPEVIETIRAVISQMKDFEWKRLSEMSLKTITEKPGANNSC